MEFVVLTAVEATPWTKLARHQQVTKLRHTGFKSRPRKDLDRLGLLLFAYDLVATGTRCFNSSYQSE
jgi:hypothetical protein